MMTNALQPLGRRAAGALAALLADPARLAGFGAVALGLLFILGVGFAGPAAVHDAAHDVRHAMAFPCH